MPTHCDTPTEPPIQVTLREVLSADIPTLYSFERDPVWGATAKVKPRTWEVFEAVWAKIIRERATDTAPASPQCVQRAILANGELCGTIGLHLHNSRPALGYGLGPEFWGRGIATRAVSLLFAEGGPMAQRPLYATCAASNLASIRILLKQGFVISERRTAPETDRTLAREEVGLILK